MISHDPKVTRLELLRVAKDIVTCSYGSTPPRDLSYVVGAVKQTTQELEAFIEEAAADAAERYSNKQRP